MKKIAIIVQIAMLAFSCKNEMRSMYRNGYIVKANITGDSVLEGKTEWYKNDTLKKVICYEKGVKNGYCLNFYSNGNVYDSSWFFYGIQNGYRYVNNPKGNLVYIDYYHYGKKMGPQYFFDNGYATYYTFDDFENHRVFDVAYNKGAASIIKGAIINIVPYPTSEEGMVGLFIYLMNPPRISISYSLTINNTLTKQVDSLITFSKYKLFVDTLLPKIGNGKFYQIRANVFDSTSGKGTVYINDAVY